jgi:hypothetical protein
MDGAMPAPVSDTSAGTMCAYRSLVSNEIWQGIVDRLQGFGMQQPLAERVANEALGYLKLWAAEPGALYFPSAMVLYGLRAFMEDRQAFDTFCYDLAGRRFEHDLTEAPPEASISLTRLALLRYGPMDETLWQPWPWEELLGEER